MKLEKVIEFAKKNGYDGAEPRGEWKGYEVYEPTFKDSGEELAIVGLPLVILVKGEEIRMSTPDEALERLDDIEDDDEE